MPSFDSDGVEIAYIDEGEGEPLLLVHGFASNVADNWVDPGWVRTLTQSGRRVIAYDNRGHGRSDKLYDPDVYGAPLMAEDARRLLDHLAITQRRRHGLFDGRPHRRLSRSGASGRVRSAILGGLGINMVRGMVGSGPIAKALEAPRIEDVTNDTARSFRAFAEQTKKRSQGACRLYQGTAREDHAGAARDHRRAHACRRG